MEIIKRSLFFSILLSLIILSSCSAQTSWWKLDSQKKIQCDWSKVNNKVLISGSSTIAPFMNVILNSWSGYALHSNYALDVIGSTAGLERLVNYGETDVAMSSRKITDDELQQADKFGRDVLEFPLGWDELTVAVSKGNNFVKTLTLPELAQVFSTAETWNQLNSSWPNKPIYRFVLGEKSGSSDFFAQQVLASNKESMLQALNTQVTEEDTILVRGLQNIPNSIGFLGSGAMKEHGKDLRAVALNGLLPSSDLHAGYPLVRGLYLYVNPQSIHNNPAAASVLIYLFQNYGVLISQTGYLPVSQDILNANQEKLLKVLNNPSTLKEVP